MLFAKLQEVNYILRESEKWVLTAKGKLAGGRIKTSAKLGDYIEWPDNFDLALLPTHQSPDVPVELVSSTKIGNEFGISANKLNYLFSELGWVNKSLKGWVATDQGLKQGAVQSEDSRSGVPYVRWPETITTCKVLLSSVNDLMGSNTQLPTDSSNTTDVKIKLDAKFKATDGHVVQSKAEVMIDNWLYMAEIVHAYERKLPIEENVFCDFYIPTGKVYIEYWGYDDDPKYLARKAKKLAVYEKYGFKLIELDDTDVQKLDDILPRLLLKYGVQAY
ncbi:glycerol kinase [uncultured Paraglaciecola sp.]|uniref:glycerol kinase n=1 Tax=uncultured Paraglaciecola sp. TaxID=1765024 RepID=UPI0025D4D55E|nr:glycerol kinase [uncultured Paraglaciecola sp.]